MLNHVTFDIEYWYHRPPFKNCERDQIEADVHLERAVNLILEALRRYNSTSTFFVVGEVASKNPQIVKSIRDAGHEIAFHGYSHSRLPQLTRESFKQELEDGIKVLGKATNQKIIGFRAPMFSLNLKTAWAISELAHHDFLYDSSIVPASALFYGNSNAMTVPYFMDEMNPYIESVSSDAIKEFPLLIRYLPKMRLPAAGGIWLRLFGEKFVLKAIRNYNKEGKKCVLYFHPWELVRFDYKASLPRRVYGNLGIPAYRKFEKILSEITSVSIAQALREK